MATSDSTTRAEPRQGLLDLVSQANVRLKKSDDHRVAAAILIAQIKTRVENRDPEAAGLGWKKFATKHFKKSYSEIKRLARAGASNDPAAVLNEMNSRAADSMRKSRLRKVDRTPKADLGSNVGAPPNRNDQPTGSEAGTEATRLDQTVGLIEAMDESERGALVCQTHGLLNKHFIAWYQARGFELRETNKNAA